MSNPSTLPQLFFSLDESLPEVISLESDLTFATPGPTSSQVPGPAPQPFPPGQSPIPPGQPGGPGGPTIPTGGSDAGHTIETAMDMGVVAGQLNFGGNVGGSDPADVYRFTLSQAGDLSVLLSGMSGDADLGVFDSSGNLLGTSATAGNVDEGLMGTNMAAGTYYAAIIPYQGASVSYNLTISSGGAGPTQPPLPGPAPSPFPGPTQPPFPGASSNSVEIESLPIEFALA